MATVTAGQVAGVVSEIRLGGDLVLETIAGIAPGVALEAAAAEQALNLLTQLAGKAINAVSAVSGVPITVELIESLKTNAAALSEPDAG